MRSQKSLYREDLFKKFDEKVQDFLRYHCDQYTLPGVRGHFSIGKLPKLEGRIPMWTYEDLLGCIQMLYGEQVLIRANATMEDLENFLKNRKHACLHPEDGGIISKHYTASVWVTCDKRDQITGLPVESPVVEIERESPFEFVCNECGDVIYAEKD